MSRLASYATLPQNSKGRLYDDIKCNHRSIYRRDYDRITTCNSFRRLQYKTQVFVNHEGDHYRTRLTHSIEVAQIARWITSAMNLNEDLAEVLAIGHDLGHTPFGHAGEEELHVKVRQYGGNKFSFSHNEYVLKILTKLEHRYAEFDGLNLTWEVLDGVIKHNGPVSKKNPKYKNNDVVIPKYIARYSKIHDLNLNKFSSLEAQIAAIADDIAYNNHDIEDGIRAGMFSIEELMVLPVIGDSFKEVKSKYPDIHDDRWISETKRLSIRKMVYDVIETTQQNIAKFGIKTSEDVRECGQTLVHFSNDMAECDNNIKSFLMDNMYRHYRVNRMTTRAKQIISDLFDYFMQNPLSLPTKWYQRTLMEDSYTNNQEEVKIDTISDYIAGLTDRYAIQEWESVI